MLSLFFVPDFIPFDHAPVPGPGEAEALAKLLRPQKKHVAESRTLVEK
jgi:hypothetical protein